MSNFIEILAQRERDNTKFDYYQDNRELFDELGEAGVKFVDSPAWTSWLHGNNPFTVGNTIVVPKEAGFLKDLIRWGRVGRPENEGNPFGKEHYESYGEFIAGEEVPHVAQYREEGLLKFLGRYVSDMFQHGILGGHEYGNIYETEGTHEGFHFKNPEEKKRLFEEVLPSE